jgi:hypothetical protein
MKKSDVKLNTTVTDHFIQMDLKVDKKDWKFQVTKDWSWFPTDRQLGFEDVQPVLPSFTISMGSMDFFLTTNLLLPGEKVIDVDKSDAAGLRIPHDYMLVGNVVHKK